VKRRLLFASLALGFALLACQVVAGIERVDKTVPADAALAVDVVEAAPPPRDPCNHAFAPGIPDREDDGGAPTGPLYFAVHEMHLLPMSDAGDALGFDLDGVCTCDPRPTTAEAGASSCVATAASGVCDSDGGVDNQLEQIIAPYVKLGLDVDKGAAISAHIAEGKQGLLVYLNGYNGTKNDRDVSVSLLLSNGIEDPSGCSNAVVTQNNPKRYQPEWCGTDKWSYDPSSVLNGNPNLPANVGQGWVNDGVLVYQAAKSTVYFGGAVLTLISPRTAVRLTKVGTSWHLDGVIAGRVQDTDFLRAAGMMAIGGDGGSTYLCTQPVLFSQLKSAMCDSLDLAESEALDFQGRPCSAISFGFSFTADSASLGGPVSDPPAPNPCAGDAQPPSLYTCP
jgi:hypothetical protein